ncbi:hypothetical protein BJX61DRAFT_537813 [Aspergillus egyptiacus]|nr:hypothetical protein BJX61DRAFT_537813 [Aspergillus egyptiacus]
MYFTLRATGLVALAVLLGLAFSRPTFDAEIERELGDKDPDVITRDVCIIGGGASGTYAAIRLRELGQSVVVVEKDDRLGGHTRTYYDPAGTPIDYGVWVYANNTEAFNFFAHFDIPLTGLNLGSGAPPTERVDLRTGQRVPPPSGDVVAAMTRYAQVLMQYPYLSDGWDLPDPVPEDLFLPLRDFIEKYDLRPAAEFLTLWAQGLSDDIMDYPAAYIMKYVSMEVMLGIQLGFSSSARGANEELYVAARQELGDDALLSSTVLGADRSDSDTQRIYVRTPSGTKVIEADKIIITIPPLLSNMQVFDLDSREESLFGQFIYSYYYATVLSLPGAPPGVQITNLGADTPYNVAKLPGIYVMFPTPVENVVTAFFGGGYTNLTERQVSEVINDNVAQLRNAGIGVGEPEILAYADHSPFELHVSGEAIAGGFYRDLYSLQGHRKTFYTGAAFHAHNSAALWRFTERLLQEPPQYLSGT